MSMEPTTNPTATRPQASLTLDEADALIGAMFRGEARSCAVCDRPLELKLPGSGRHPGIYCELGCTNISLSIAVTKPRLKR
jgi:hypothetical protein